MAESIVLIEAPDEPVISLADAKKALGITGVDQDKVIEAALAATVSELDAADEGWLGRAIRPQTWELRLSGFLCHRDKWDSYCYGAIILPCPPLISMVSVKYISDAGVETTLGEETDYRVFNRGGRGKQAIAPLYNSHWPIARNDPESVKIRFTSGYEDRIPPKLTQGIILCVRELMSASTRDPQLFEDRVEGIGSKRYQNSAAASLVIRNIADGLLESLRVY